MRKLSLSISSPAWTRPGLSHAPFRGNCRITLFHLNNQQLKIKKSLIPYRRKFKDCTQLNLILSCQGNASSPETKICSRTPVESGRFSGSRICLLAIPSRPVHRPVDCHGFRPRLQRRDRDGFSPSSLLNPGNAGYLNPCNFKDQKNLLYIKN